MDVVGLGVGIAILLLLVKETGVPIPVPGDLVVLGLGVAAARGDAPLVPTLLAILIATVVGGFVQYRLVRGAGRAVLLGLLARVGVDRSRIDGAVERVRTGGARGLALARMTPGLRIVAIVGAGLAAIGDGAVLAGLTVGNGVFAGAHFALGFAVGPAAIGTAASAGSTLTIGVALVVVLLVVGAVGWQVRARRRVGRTASATGVLADWADACCPACLAVALLPAGDR